MKLIDAHQLLASLTKSTDNARYFKETYEHFGKQADDDLQTYIQFIFENCLEWLERLPDKLTSQEALAKPKSAVVKLLEQPSVIQELGDQLCSQAKDLLVTTWKANKDRITIERAEDHDDLEQSVENEIIEADEPPPSVDNQQQIAQLQQENLRLAEQLAVYQNKCTQLQEACFKVVELCYPDKKELWTLLKSLFIPC